jgi:hypothetical protein
MLEIEKDLLDREFEDLIKKRKSVSSSVFYAYNFMK